MRGFDFYLVPGDIAYINDYPYPIIEVTKDNIYIKNPDGSTILLYVKADENQFLKVGDMVSVYGRSYPITSIYDDEIYFQKENGEIDVIHIDRDRLQVDGLNIYHTVRLEKSRVAYESELETILDENVLLEILNILLMQRFTTFVK